VSSSPVIWRCRLWHTLCATASAASVSSHGDALLQFLDILEVLDRTLNFPAIDGLCSFAGVLERDSQVRAARTGTLRRGDVLRSVSDLGVVQSVFCRREFGVVGTQWPPEIRECTYHFVGVGWERGPSVVGLENAGR
jgi:hypothetical protein